MKAGLPATPARLVGAGLKQSVRQPHPEKFKRGVKGSVPFTLCCCRTFSRALKFSVMAVLFCHESSEAMF